jgi:TatA/E family protein of Tat protein translocase
MFGLGFWEIAIILAVALLVLGPSKLPDLARGLGKGLREFRKATEDFKSTIDEEVYRPDPPKTHAPIAEKRPAEPLPQSEAEQLLAAPKPIMATADPVKQADLPDEPKSPTES